MKEIDLHTRLDAYLALREALGVSTRACRKLMQDFVAYLEKHGDGKPIRAQLALDWACSTSATCGASGQAARLGLARGFLIHLKASLPETEIPDKHLLAAPRRPQPHLFSAVEISRVLEEAARIGPRGSLRPHTVLVQKLSDYTRYCGKEIIQTTIDCGRNFICTRTH